MTFVHDLALAEVYLKRLLRREKQSCTIPDIRRRPVEPVKTTLCGRLSVGKGFLVPLQRWLVRPCVRPVCAAHTAAGRNAIRVSGPDHLLALEVLGRNGFS